MKKKTLTSILLTLIFSTLPIHLYAAIGENFEDIYTQDPLPLITTGNSRLFTCRHKQTNDQYIVKTYTLKTPFAMDNEIAIMLELKGFHHPNVIAVKDEFKTDNLRHLIFKKYQCDLYDYIVQENLKTQQLKALYRQITRGVLHLHQHEIAHRDLSIENILIDEHMNATICDFGAATQRKSTCYDFRGKLVYAAPEIFNNMRRHRPYDPYAADIWALGITFYTMATQTFAFEQAQNSDLTYQEFKLCNGNWQLFLERNEHRHQKTKHLGQGFVDLLNQTANPQHSKRITPAQILQHPWLNEQNSLDENHE